MATAKITRISGVFSGIYGWGNGFYSSEKAIQWYNYWQNYKGIFWKVLNEDFAGQITTYLVNTTGSIYMHPMDFTAIMCDINEMKLEELKTACEECAKACGGSFSMSVAHTNAEFGIHYPV